MVNFRPLPIDFEILLDDSALEKARHVGVRLENQPAPGQILDVAFERRGRQDAAILQSLA
jgi:hypothetical protein